MRNRSKTRGIFEKLTEPYFQPTCNRLVQADMIRFSNQRQETPLPRCPISFDFVNYFHPSVFDFDRSGKLKNGLFFGVIFFG